MNRKELMQIAKPILFNTEMVRAIKEGRKTETRRVIKRDITNFCDVDTDGELLDYEDSYGDFINPADLCRYKPGDILYVRETWRKHSPGTDAFIYRADYPDEYHRKMGFKPSIHMPKEAARIFLRITKVRVERLQAIKNEQILNEGIKKEEFDRYIGQMPEKTEEYVRLCHLIPWRELWDSTIKKQDLSKYGWDANPWVWIIEFERIEVEEA